ncbi:MAG: DNA-binding response regulator, partial [Planctomycetes bacterium]|nr:DNA-binding response regulator [Planctomycetota bacterium]
IVLDYLMPVMDGREMLRRLRHTKRTPIMMLTARNSVDDRVAGLDLGADDYVSKPFVQQELLARLRALHDAHDVPYRYGEWRTMLAHFAS